MGKRLASYALAVGFLLAGCGTTTPSTAAPASPAGNLVPISSPTPAPTPAATRSAPAERGLPVGPHVILTGQADNPADTFKPLTVTIPAPGWEGEVGGGILLKNDRQPPDGAGMIIFVGREYIVYGDACHWKTTVPKTPVTTVRAFVDALASQKSRTASKPVDITLGGYAGKSITLRVPDDVDFAACDPGYGGSWDCGKGGDTPCGWHTGSRTEIDTVYLLDLDGQVMAWLTNHHTGTSEADVAQLEAIVRSASFGD